MNHFTEVHTTVSAEPDGAIITCDLITSTRFNLVFTRDGKTEKKKKNPSKTGKKTVFEVVRLSVGEKYNLDNSTQKPAMYSYVRI